MTRYSDNHKIKIGVLQLGSAEGGSACANNTSSPTLSFQSGLFNGFVRNAYGSSTSRLEACGG